jgi:hypothetical protein
MMVAARPEPGNIPIMLQALADYVGRRSRHEQAVMEPWIDGEPLSMSLLCGAGEVEVLAVNRQTISFDESGFLHFDGVTPDAVHGSRLSNGLPGPQDSRSVSGPRGLCRRRRHLASGSWSGRH